MSSPNNNLESLGTLLHNFQTFCMAWERFLLRGPNSFYCICKLFRYIFFNCLHLCYLLLLLWVFIIAPCQYGKVPDMETITRFGDVAQSGDYSSLDMETRPPETSVFVFALGKFCMRGAQNTRALSKNTSFFT